MDFYSDLAKTNTPEAKAVYEKAMAACLNRGNVTLRFTTEAEDRAGIDFYASYGTGHRVEESVQVKICWGGLGYPFYPYETTNQSGGPGWVYSHEPADLILWIRAEEGFTEWNARLYRMLPIIDYFKSDKSHVLSRTKKNRFGSAGLYFLPNDEAEKWLVGSALCDTRDTCLGTE